jgi:hypothetical protein
MNENNGVEKEGLFLVMGIKRLFSRFIGFNGLIYGGVGEASAWSVYGYVTGVSERS